MVLETSLDGYIFPESEFGDWLSAQQGGLVVGKDASFTAATDALFLGLGAFNALFITVRVAALKLTDDGTSSEYDIPVGNWWLVGSHWAESSFSGEGSGVGCTVYATAFHTTFTEAEQTLRGLNSELIGSYDFQRYVRT